MAEVEWSSSPYRPGFNQAPVVLAGRDDVMTAAEEAIAIAALDRRTPPPLLLVGARGVGKTVLLGEIAERAGVTHGWPSIHVETTPATPLGPELVDAAANTIQLLDGPSRERSRPTETIVRARVAGVGAERRYTRESPPDRDPTLAISEALRELARRLIDHGSGVVLTLDEVQLADRAEMARFAAVLQKGTGKE